MSRLKWLSREVYVLGDRLGVHLLPKHYYSPVQDAAWLQEHAALWAHPVALTGVEWNAEQQLQWIHRMVHPFLDELNANAVTSTCAEAGLGYGHIESQLLYGFVRSAKPQTIIEIGGGVSTCIMVAASRRNHTENIKRPSIISIEPYPSSYLRQSTDVDLIRTPCQAVPIDFYKRLSAGDLLFVDSSHSVKTGSDVVKICLEILPVLSSGVYVHIHDIYLPYLYPRDTFSTFFGWQETTLVAALLTNNPRLAIQASMSGLFYERSEQLKEIFPDYVPQSHGGGLQLTSEKHLHFPSSLWLLTK